MRESPLVGTSFRTVATTVAIMAASLLTSMLTARQLGPAGRGALAAFVLLATLSSTASQLGLATAWIHGTRRQPDAPYRGVMPPALAVVAMLAPLLAWGLSTRLDTPVFERPSSLLLLLLLASVSAAFLCVATLAQGRQNLALYNAGRALVPIGLLGYALLAQVELAPVSYVDYAWAQTLLTAAVAAAMGWRFFRPDVDAAGRAARRLRASVQALRGFASHALAQHATVLTALLVMNVDKLYLLHRVGTADFGFYALAFTTTRVLGVAQDAMTTAIFARHAGFDEAALSAAVRTAFRMTFVPMLLAAAAVALLSPWLIGVVFGDRFAPMALPFSILAVESVVGASSNMLAQRVTGAGRAGVMALRNVGLLAALAVALWLLPVASQIVAMALLMLGLAFVRLSVSLAMFPLLFGEPVPGLLPRRADAGLLRRSLQR